MDKVPPHSVEIEEAVLGACILNKTSLLFAIEKIDFEDFYLYGHQLLFKALAHLKAKNYEIDSIVLSNFLKEQGKFETIGGSSTIIDLTRNCVSVNVSIYIKKLKELSARRKAITASKDVINDAYDPSLNIDDVLGNMNNNFSNIVVEQEDSCFSVKELIEKEHLESGKAIKTGFETIDEYLYGLFRQEVTIIAARPSLGKTSLATNIAEKVAVEKPVLFHSLEMPGQAIVTRMISGRTGIFFRRIQEGKVNNDERKKIDAAKEEISKLNMLIDDEPNINIDKFVMKCNRINQRTQLGLIACDYAQLFSSSVKGSGNDRVTDVSRKIKGVARSCNVPLLFLSQLSRAVDSRSDPRPVLGDLRESGSLEQDADNVIFIWQWPEGHANHQKDLRELTVAKQRHGPLGTFSMIFELSRTRFRDCQEGLKEDDGQLRMEYIHD